MRNTPRLSVTLELEKNTLVSGCVYCQMAMGLSSYKLQTVILSLHNCGVQVTIIINDITWRNNERLYAYCMCTSQSATGNSCMLHLAVIH